jgi:hypothetical protein
MITYIRDQGKWIVTEGDQTAEFNTRASAELFVLRLQRPDLWDLIVKAHEKFPGLTTRMQKAAFLVHGGSNIHPSATAGITQVKSQSADGRVYLVDENRITCTCHDYQHGGAVGPRGVIYCKHILAVVIWHTINGDFEPPKTKTIATNGPNGIHIQKVPVGIPGTYLNGEPIPEAERGEADFFQERTGQHPANRRQVINYIMR